MNGFENINNFSSAEFVVFGKQGQLAKELQIRLPQAHFISSQEASFLNPTTCLEKLNTLKFKYVINSSAYTAVDKAEDEPSEALQINATTPGMLSDFCKSKNKMFVSVSTDYVFDGQASTPYKRNTPTKPLNIYGSTKAQGEQVICKNGGLVVRSSWVVSPWSKNFVRTIFQLIQQRPELKIVSDQKGCPTLASSLADFCIAAALQAESSPHLKGQIWHWCDQPETNWFEIAKCIWEYSKKRWPTLVQTQNLQAIQSWEYPTKAKRPLFSVLDCSETLQAFPMVKQRNWRLDVPQILEELARNETKV